MRYLIFTFLLACSTPHTKVSNKLDNQPHASGWQKKKFPVAPSGFEVIKLANGLKRPVWAYETPGGDILIAEEDQISILRDTNGDGKLELKSVFLRNLNHPSGMAIIGNWFYVATTDEIKRYHYQEGMTAITEAGLQVAKVSEEGREQWMHNLVVSESGTKIYAVVGSERDNVHVMDTDGKNDKVFAYGLRHPIGMDWHPHTGQLWVVAHDFLTVIKQGYFYGWPFKGKIPKKFPRVRVPHLKLETDSESFGLTFYHGKSFGPQYRSGAFISQSKSHKVSFVPFSKGYPSGPAEDFLTGFISNEKSEIHGRPSGLIELNRGELLVCDDLGNAVWLIRSRDSLSPLLNGK